MNLKKIARWLRMLVLLGILAYVTYESYMHQILGGGKASSVHALCPFGALESLYTLFIAGSFIKKIYSGTVVLLIVTVLLALVFRRSFCGLLCPFGALQDVVSYIRQKIFKRRFAIPKQFDYHLRYLKYVVLIITIAMAWIYGELWMSPYDPYSAYSHLYSFSDSIKEEPLAIVGFIILALTLVGSFLYDRFFCKYLCPMGAFYGIIGKISPSRIVRDNDKCIHCKICNKSCPVNIDIEKATKVTSAECINCNECVTSCPVKGALEIKAHNKKVQPVTMIILVTALFFGSIYIADITGNFQVIPDAIKKGESISITEIKGYYTIEDAATATGIPLQQFYIKMSIPESVSKGTKMKDISKEVPDYSFDEAKAKAEK